jgi:hypothetical protein
MTTADAHRESAEAALNEAHRNPVMSADQSFRAAQIHALLAIDARLAQLVDDLVMPRDLVASR